MGPLVPILPEAKAPAEEGMCSDTLGLAGAQPAHRQRRAHSAVTHSWARPHVPETLYKDNHINNISL